MEGFEDEQGQAKGVTERSAKVSTERSAFRVKTQINNHLTQYLNYNKNEIDFYNKFIGERKEEAEKNLEQQRLSDSIKYKEIQSLVRVKKTVIQNLVPKFFLSKLLEKKNLEKLSDNQSGTVEFKDESPMINSKTKEKEKDPDQTNKLIKVYDNSAQNSRFTVDKPQKSPLLPMGNAKTPFALNSFSSQAFHKITMTGNISLYLKNKSTNYPISVNCARESFCMVMPYQTYSRHPRRIYALGGIGSDIVPTLDSYDIKCKQYSNFSHHGD